METARANSYDPNFRSPWVVEAAKAGVLPWWERIRPRGGKLDDCTAIVICMEPADALQRPDAQRDAGARRAIVTAKQ